MKKTVETSFKRIETKYVVNKEDLDDLLKDLKKYVVEDDYPISTISNIYFDTEDFDVIQDALAKQNRREKDPDADLCGASNSGESGFSRSKIKGCRRNWS